MSYVSLLKNIPEIVSQPTGIAAIASLGLHGAIALMVPLMPVDSSKSQNSNSSETVGLMELSPSDQSRLPQTPVTSQVPIPQPQLPLQQQLPPANLGNPSTVLPPIDPALSGQGALPSVPRSAANYTLSSLSQRQYLQRFSRNNFQADISDLQLKSTFSPSTSSIVAPPSPTIRETQPLDINRLPQVQTNNTIPVEPLKNPSPEPIDIGSTTTPQNVSQLPTVPVGENNFRISQNNSSVTAYAQPTAVPGSSTSPTPDLPTSPQNTTQPSTELTKKETIIARLNSYNNLRRQIQQEYPKASEKAVIRETIATEKPGQEGLVLGRLVVDGDGKVLDIKFQEDSGSPELKLKARQFFSANPPKGDKETTSSYPFQLRFQNSRTITPSTPATPEKESPAKPETNNQPEGSATTTLKPASNSPENTQKTEIDADSSEKLILKLRSIKQERENSTNSTMLK
jgi:hypothetical protein